jgi:pantetheine-phosphate adenylyltransferase
MKRIAVYPGSFDPITIGHLQIIEKACRLFDEVHLIVANNVKKPATTFSVAERIEMIKASTKHVKNIKIDSFDGRTLTYAESVKACAIIRGLRNARDFDNELTMYYFNHNMNPAIETVILLPSADSLFISSSYIKELALIKANFSKYVPKEAYQTIFKKLNKK